jgi:hypothetical protein
MKSIKKQRNLGTLKKQDHINFADTCEKEYDKTMKEMILLFTATNCYVAYTSYSSWNEIAEPFLIPSFIFGFLSHFFSTMFVNTGNALTGLLWRNALAFIRLRMNDIESGLVSLEAKNMKQNQIFPKKYLEVRTQTLLTKLTRLKNDIEAFDKCLQWTIFASVVSVTPVVCCLVHSFFFGEEDDILHFIQVPIIVILTSQALFPLYQVSQVYSSSLRLHSLFCSLYARNHPYMSRSRKDLLLIVIEMLGNRAKPLSLYLTTGAPFIPSSFYEVGFFFLIKYHLIPLGFLISEYSCPITPSSSRSTVPSGNCNDSSLVDYLHQQLKWMLETFVEGGKDNLPGMWQSFVCRLRNNTKV